jgi:very-short-patch-repair endonuclease
MAEGFSVVRYWNNDVLQQPAAVLEDILTKLSER